MTTQWLAGMRITAARLSLPVTVSSLVSSSFDATAITYGTATTGGTYSDCAVVFVAPDSGQVTVYTSGRMVNTGSTTGSLLAPETRLGGTIGVGTVVEAAADTNGASHYGNTFCRAGVTHLLSGLTPGTTYNTRILHRLSTATGDTATFANRELIVQPA
jgi:hypothetical protein